MSSTPRSSSRPPASIFSPDADGETTNGTEPRTLTGVPEEDHSARDRPPSSPYSMSSPAASTSTFNLPSTSRTTRKPSSIRTLGRSSNDQLNAANISATTSTKRTASTSSSTTAGTNGSTSKTSRSGTTHIQVPPLPGQRIRSSPRLPHDKDVALAPSTIMYWSKAPVWGTIPTRTMRAHTVTLVDTTAWLFGGCDDKDSSKDIYCFDTGERRSQSFSIPTY